jgi:hypothetical protein
MSTHQSQEQLPLVPINSTAKIILPSVEDRTGEAGVAASDGTPPLVIRNYGTIQSTSLSQTESISGLSMSASQSEGAHQVGSRSRPENTQIASDSQLDSISQPESTSKPESVSRPASISQPESSSRLASTSDTTGITVPGGWHCQSHAATANQYENHFSIYLT